MSGLIAPKLCAYCREAYTPTKPSRRFCSKRCSARWIGLHHRGETSTAKARATRKKNAAIHAAEVLAAQFGELSEREVELYTYTHNLAYTRGFNAARYTYTQKRKPVAA